MALIVQKFGGSSVADIERIQKVANIVAETRKQGNDVIVVVSAMYGETDRLIKLAHSISDTCTREYDALLATGEQASAALLSICLESLGCPACSLTANQVRIVTTDDFKKARIIDVERSRLDQELQQGRIPVVTGFQGVTMLGDVTTLGRGGSDLTAVAIAAVMEADECQIYTDVDGVYTSDPKIVPDAKRITRITFNEMMELASLGAKVLQNRCLEYAGKYQVPVRVLSSLQQGGGTLISYAKYGNEAPRVSGVAFERKQAQITLQGVRRRPGLMSYLLGPISQAKIDIDMIVQNAPNEEGFVDLSFTLQRDDLPEAHSISVQVAAELEAKAVLVADCVAKLSLVGVGLRSHAGVASMMLATLGQEGVEIHLLTASEIKISAIIDEKFLDLGARVLHQAFDLNGLTQ